jgi:NAD-reducing hydrogenase small subunit
MKRARLATVWLDGCSGCHMSVLDIDEAIIPIAKQECPKAVEVVLIEGAISSQEDLEKVRLMRQRSKLVVALGDCAVTGNVPAMRNQIVPRKLLERIYIEGVQENPGIPTEGVPALLRHAIPVHEVVKVDLHVPGCPPPAAAIAFVLGELLDGRVPDLSSKVKFG